MQYELYSLKISLKSYSSNFLLNTLTINIVCNMNLKDRNGVCTLYSFQLFIFILLYIYMLPVYNHWIYVHVAKINQLHLEFIIQFLYIKLLTDFYYFYIKTS